jgi:hypothetical protein
MQSATSSATLGARVGFWSDRLSFDLSATQWLFGETFGPTPVSLASGWEFQIEAHNTYVQFINTIGFIGFGLLIAFLVSRIRYTIRLHHTTQTTLLVSIAAYGFFYFYPAYTAIFLADNDEQIEAENATKFQSLPSNEYAIGRTR